MKTFAALLVLISSAFAAEVGIGHSKAHDATPQTDYMWISLAKTYKGLALDAMLQATQEDAAHGVTAQAEAGYTYTAPGKLDFFSTRAGVGYLFQKNNTEYWNIEPVVTYKLPKNLQKLDAFVFAGASFERAFDASYEFAQYSLGVGLPIKGHVVTMKGFTQHVQNNAVGLELAVRI